MRLFPWKQAGLELQSAALSTVLRIFEAIWQLEAPVGSKMTNGVGLRSRVTCKYFSSSLSSTGTPFQVILDCAISTLFHWIEWTISEPSTFQPGNNEGHVESRTSALRLQGDWWYCLAYSQRWARGDGGDIPPGKKKRVRHVVARKKMDKHWIE